jgi:hypothetical protein
MATGRTDDEMQAITSIRVGHSASAVIFIVASVIALQGFAQTSLPRIETTQRGSIPSQLYHWTDEQGVKQLGSSLDAEGALTIVPAKPPKGTVEHLDSYVPWLTKMPKLFAWTHPVTGMGFDFDSRNTSLIDVYGDILVKIDLNKVPSSKVLTVHSSDDGVESTVKPKDVWLVHHFHYGNATFDVRRKQKDLLFEEWIITNPAAVKAITADPEALAPILETELRQLKSSRFKYPQEALHRKNGAGFANRADARKEIIIPTLETYVSEAGGKLWLYDRIPQNLLEGACSKLKKLRESPP